MNQDLRRRRRRRRRKQYSQSICDSAGGVEDPGRTRASAFLRNFEIGICIQIHGYKYKCLHKYKYTNDAHPNQMKKNGRILITLYYRNKRMLFIFGHSHCYKWQVSASAISIYRHIMSTKHKVVYREQKTDGLVAHMPIYRVYKNGKSVGQELADNHYWYDLVFIYKS